MWRIFRTKQSVKIWFQNRRTKWKKHDNISNAEAAEHKAQQAPQQVPLRKEQTKNSSGASSRPGLKPPTGSPSSGDEHSNGSMMTGDGSVSESCFSEPDASRSAPLPPISTSPSTASLSPVVPGVSLPEVRPPASPHLVAETAGSVANTPAPGATAATPSCHPSSCTNTPSPPLPTPPPTRPPTFGGANSQVHDSESYSTPGTNVGAQDQQRLNLQMSPS